MEYDLEAEGMLRNSNGYPLRAEDEHTMEQGIDDVGARPSRSMDEECRSVLNRLASAVWQCADDHGFHEPGRNDNPAAWVANMHGELSEFWEAHRADKLNAPCDKDIPLTCAEEELADIIIRALDVAGQLNINIGKAVMVKRFYNSTRPYLHGGKKA